MNLIIEPRHWIMMTMAALLVGLASCDTGSA